MGRVEGLTGFLQQPAELPLHPRLLLLQLLGPGSDRGRGYCQKHLPYYLFRPGSHLQVHQLRFLPDEHLLFLNEVEPVDHQGVHQDVPVPF